MGTVPVSPEYATLVAVAALPSILDIPVNAIAALALFNVIAVVPI